MWGNGCIHNLLTQHWVNLRVQSNKRAFMFCFTFLVCQEKSHEQTYSVKKKKLIYILVFFSCCFSVYSIKKQIIRTNVYLCVVILFTLSNY